MDFKKIFDVINKYNIDRNDVLDLVEEAKSVDLTEEENLRTIVRKGAALAGKSLTDDDEDRIINIIKQKGINPDLLDLL